MKYIMFEAETETGPKKVPVIFPDSLIHKDVARSIIHMMGMKYGWPAAAVSAGFVVLDVSPIACFGESETLSLRSDPQDADIISKTE